MASTPPAIRPPAVKTVGATAAGSGLLALPQNLSPVIQAPSPLPDPALAGLPTGPNGLLGSNPLGISLADLAGAKSDTGNIMAPLSHGSAGDPDVTALFQKSLGASRADINRMVDTALDSINHSTQLQAQQVGQIPGQLAGIYGGAQKSLSGGLSSMQGAQKAAGLQSYMPIEQQMAPLQAALTQGQANRNSLVPILQAGVQDLGQRQRGQAELARTQSLADLAGEERAFLRDKASGKIQTPEEQLAYSLAETEGKLKLDQKYNGTPAEQYKAQADAKRNSTLSTILGSLGEKDSSANRGAAIVAQNGQDYQSVVGDPDYQAAAAKVGTSDSSAWGPGDILHRAISGKAPTFSVNSLAKTLEGKGKFKAAAVLRHLYGDAKERDTRTEGLQSLLLG